MMRTHIALVGSHPLPGDPGRGGVQRVVQVLRRGLAKRMRVSLIVPDASQNLRHSDESGQIIYLKRPPYPGVLSYWTWCSRAAYREIKRLSPDLVHVQDQAGFAMLWPKRGEASRRPWVFTPHGVNDRDVLETVGRDAARRLTAPVRAATIRAIERASRSRFDSAIVINDYLLEAMPDLGEMRHHSIPNPVDEIFLKAPRTLERPASGYQLLYVGEVNTRKNIMGLIDIVQELLRGGMNAHLHVIGPVSDETYLKECIEMIGRANLSLAITFHGGLKPEEIATWMDGADALLLASKQETAPMVVAEAHCRGLPVAVPRAFGLRSMVVEGKNGIFLDGPTPTEDAARIAGLLSSGIDRDSIRNDAARMYELSNVLDRTVEVYHEALEAGVGQEQPIPC
jgi:glycosyltransferase involved in cell wall biosynthesis